MIIKKILFLFTLSFIGLTCFSQNTTIDSLYTVLKTAKEDTNKVNTLNILSDQLCGISDYEQSKSYADKAFVLSEKLNFKKGKANTYSNIGSIYSHQGKYPESLKNYSTALKIKEEIGDKKGTAGLYLGIGTIQYYQSNFPEALNNYLTALKKFEEINDKNGIANSYLGIGIIYDIQGDYPKALDNYSTSLKILEKIGDKQGIAASHNNIGNIYSFQGDYTKALESYSASLIIRREIGNKIGIGGSYNNIGSVYFSQGNFVEALKNYYAALEIRKEIGDKGGMTSSYLNLGAVSVELNKFSEAKKYYNNALTLSGEIGNKELVKNSYISLSELDSLQGNWKDAYQHYKLYTLYRDSIYNEESKEKTIHASMTYEFEKKEALTQAAQDKKDALATTEMRKLEIIRYAVSGVLVLVILFTLFLYNRFRLIRKQKNIIELKEEETQYQKNIIEEKHREITDSINYAERIQRSFMATTEILDKNLKDYFVFFKPKAIVSGDFYWAGELKDGNFAFSCADSTGHGVPGAIMSILNISSLEKSIEQETEPNKILDKTRSIIIDRLKKDGSAEGGRDGMDCSLLVINKEKTQLSFAAANNPVFIIRPSTIDGEMKQSQTLNFELIEFKPDKMPVGKDDNDTNPFNLHTTDLQKGDIIYTFTDGISDQFGGEKGKKYMIKNLRKLLLQIAPLSMQEQKQKLAQEFIAWKGEEEQVDDVCIIGVRI